jgi:putative membrane protein
MPKASTIVLAQERTLWANERTFLAYVRTACAAFVVGLAVLKFFNDSAAYYYLGLASLAIGFLFVLFGTLYYYKRKRQILSASF